MTATIRRLLSLLLVLALVALGCSGGDDDADDDNGSTDGSSEGNGGGDEDGGDELNADDEAAIEAAEEWIADESGIGDSIRESLVVAGVDSSGAVSHVRFDQVYDEHRVLDAGLTVHVLEDGSVQSATDELSGGTPPESMQMTLTEEAAVSDAAKALDGTVESTVAEAIWIQNGTDLLAAWQVQFHTSDPVADWTIVVDGLSGDVLSATQAGAERRARVEGLTTGTTSSAASPKLAQSSGDQCDLPDAPSACIFLVDPIYASGGDASLTADDANAFLTGVELLGLDDPDDGDLVGEFADLNQNLNPTSEAQDDAQWGAGRGQRGFEAQNAYYWIDYGQRTVQRLGFDDNLNRSFPVVALDPDTLDNAFYSPAEQQIYMGTGTTGGGINESEDASGILHEYGHALLDDVNPGLLGGETGAYHEGFGDIFAYLTTLEYRTGDAECFFIWTDQECLRRMDGESVYPDDLVQEPHVDGEIYTGAIYDVLGALLDQEGLDIDGCPGSDDCNEVRDRVLTTVLASNYYIGSNDSLPDIAAHYLSANEAQYGDADRDLIEAAFAEHGLAGGGGGGGGGGGDGEVLVELDISHSYRGDLRVTVGVVDADGNALCDDLELFTPDEEDGEDNLSGTVDVSDSDCAQFVPPGPDQQWFVFVEDTLAEDEGQLISFVVHDEGVPYPALGLPLPIIDADPTGTTAFVGVDGGSSGASSGLGGEIDPSQPYVSVTINHEYHGDLQIRAGVADATDTIICSVVVLDPDLTNSTGGELAGDIDMTECAAFYPPTPDQRWFLTVADTALIDEGTVDQFTVVGPDGTIVDYDFGGSPAAVPDNDVDGIALLLDGSTATQGQAGGSGQGADVELPAVSVVITHSYAGDLLVTAGVADAQGRTLCEVALFSPDSSNDSDDVVGDVSLSECGEFYPPTPDQQWFLFVADTLEVDEGTLDHFSLTGPDGIVYNAPDAGLAIPDADPDGVALLLDGDEAGSGMSVPTVSLLISHPYVGDLEAYVGVVDAANNILCEVQVSAPDIQVTGVDLSLDVELPECSAFYPPSPDQRWYISAWDHFEIDTGSIEAFILFGPDGAIYDHPGVPLPIPDADPVTGVGLEFDGSQLPIVIAPDGPSGDLLASIAISHTYSGDLDVYVGVADDSFNSLCEIQLIETDSTFGEPDIFGDFSVDDCAEFYPPGPGQQWYLLAIDNLEIDEGSIDDFTLIGPDGSVFSSPDVPVDIPDADLEGAFALISG